VRIHLTLLSRDWGAARPSLQLVEASIVPRSPMNDPEAELGAGSMPPPVLAVLNCSVRLLKSARDKLHHYVMSIRNGR
jgi:hypothetical protein